MDNDVKIVIIIAIFIMSLIGIVLYSSVLMADLRLQCISKIIDKSATEILLICDKK